MYLEGSREDFTYKDITSYTGHKPIEILYSVKDINKRCYDYKSSVEFFQNTKLKNKNSLMDFLSKRFPNA